MKQNEISEWGFFFKKKKRKKKKWGLHDNYIYL